MSVLSQSVLSQCLLTPVHAACARRAALTNMSNVKRFIARYKIEDMRMPLNDEGVRMWRVVADALELTPNQCAATVQLWRSFRCGPPAFWRSPVLTGMHVVPTCCPWPVILQFEQISERGEQTLPYNQTQEEEAAKMALPCSSGSLASRQAV
jgi:hypothetical protein